MVVEALCPAPSYLCDDGACANTASDPPVCVGAFGEEEAAVAAATQVGRLQCLHPV